MDQMNKKKLQLQLQLQQERVLAAVGWYGTKYILFCVIIDDYLCLNGIHVQKWQ
jgi:hypothetical protein